MLVLPWCAFGCDVGSADLERARGPELGLIAAWPVPGEGLKCLPSDPADCGVPTDTTIQLRFSRYLMPATAVRQSLLVYAGEPDNDVFLEPEYDVMERVVVYRLPEGELLQPETLYRVQLRSREAPADFGFAAYDAAPLGEEAGLALEYSFFTARELNPVEASPRSVVPTCEELLARVFRPSCSSCHRRSAPAGPPHGLRLDDPAALVETAIGKLAQQTSHGPDAQRTLKNPKRFGLQMPVVAPGEPGNSYLFYKLLLDPRNFRGQCEAADGRAGVEALDGTCEAELAPSEVSCLSDPCGTCYQVELPPGSCLPPDEAERLQMQKWFISGGAMPLEGPDGPRSVTKRQLRWLQRWIAAGARCE